VQHAEHIGGTSPWRAATIAVGLVAAVELVVLVAVGVVHLAPSRHAAASRPVVHAAAPVTHVALPPSQPLRPRAHVRVLVLNGNGVSGAAAGAAQHLELEGYRIGATTNAPRHDYAQSMVMYVPGWAKEARRLARDADVRLVAPIDGLVPAQLKGSKIVLLLGT
jgi:LytR cell envelope-related transcriptional attenuator